MTVCDKVLTTAESANTSEQGMNNISTQVVVTTIEEGGFCSHPSDKTFSVVPLLDMLRNLVEFVSLIVQVYLFRIPIHGNKVSL